jgi:glutamate formiminotransferase
MTGWVECVPNFSEGRNDNVIRAIESAIAGVPQVYLLDLHTDRSHNRSVYTFVGEPDAVAEAAFCAVRTAVELIDLNRHFGVHPRMGAADVIPFVPLPGITHELCVALATGLGERVGRELQVPVYLYGDAATQSNRRDLPNIRRGEFEGLLNAVQADATKIPDHGPAALHATAGATAIGVRSFLVAFNVALDTPDVRVAKEIARQIRTSSGGLPALQAKGFLVAGNAQVSMNLLDCNVVSPQTAFDMVKRLAGEEGVHVRESEFVGLVPERAVSGCTSDSLQLNSPLEDQLLEPKIRLLREQKEERG